MPAYGYGDLAGWVRPRDDYDTDDGVAYGPRNGFRLPAYVRLDLSATGTSAAARGPTRSRSTCTTRPTG